MIQRTITILDCRAGERNLPSGARIAANNRLNFIVPWYLPTIPIIRVTESTEDHDTNCSSPRNTEDPANLDHSPRYLVAKGT